VSLNKPDTENMKSIHTEDIIWIIIGILVIGGGIAYGIHVRMLNNSIKVIDNCEYIRTYNGHGWNLTHKGNCTNNIHYNK
jgi:hypothetical protein